VVETAIDNADRYYRVVGSGIDGVSSVEQSRAFKAVAQSWLAKQEVRTLQASQHTQFPFILGGKGLWITLYLLEAVSPWELDVVGCRMRLAWKGLTAGFAQ
jgi:hypothetical protein